MFQKISDIIAKYVSLLLKESLQQHVYAAEVFHCGKTNNIGCGLSFWHIFLSMSVLKNWDKW